MRHAALRLLCLLCAAIGWTAPAPATPGPTTTLLVVNGDSPLSVTLANHWLQLRNLPDNHVLVLPGPETIETLSMEGARTRLLEPIEAHLERIGLADRIDVVAYSADFPYAVDLLEPRRQAGLRHSERAGTAASLTGVTFHAQAILDGQAARLPDLRNHYFRRELRTHAGALLEPDAYARALSDLEARLRKGRAAEGLAELDRLARAHPGDPRLHILSARALVVLGDTREALRRLEKAVLLGWRNAAELREDPWLSRLEGNSAFEALLERIRRQPVRLERPVGFRNAFHWNRETFAGGPGDRYRLGILLAYTGRQGNSLPEILRYLERSAAADATRPDGTVYLMKNDDIRSRTRQPWFHPTCRLLESLGRRCEIVAPRRGHEDGILPRGRKDIIGLVAGTRDFRWQRYGSRMLAGAIAESLTSFGGDFDNPSQTKLTEFLRHGASGSSGAVVEPYALPEKFPLPYMHYWYALGYSLAESWYMAVAAPYQALLVGDPLTRPFAEADPPALAEPDTETPWRGRVQIRARLRDPERFARLELWVDGRPLASAAPGAPLNLDTGVLADGWHRLDLVAEERDPRGARQRSTHRFRVDNHGLHVSLESPADSWIWDRPLLLEGEAPPDSRVTLWHLGRPLATVEAPEGRWQAVLEPGALGLGPARVTAVARTGDGRTARSAPLLLRILPPPDLPALPPPAESGSAGLVLRYTHMDARGRIRDHRKPLKAVDGRLHRLLPREGRILVASVSGLFRVERDGYHQLAVRTRGKVRITLDTQEWEAAPAGEGPGMLYFTTFLEKGWHRIAIRPDPAGLGQLLVVIGGNDPPRALGEG